LDWVNFSYTRPVVVIKTVKGTLLLNVKGIRQTHLKDTTTLNKIHSLCEGLGSVQHITSCSRDLKELNPHQIEVVGKDINNLTGLNNPGKLFKNVTENKVWFTVQ
jgi:hypothetical protein